MRQEDEKLRYFRYLNQSKLAMARFLLPDCPFMRIDATRPDVDVPGTIRREELVLRIGEDPNVLGMPDLVLEDQGWRGTISLQGFRYVAMVSWLSVSHMWLEQGPVVVWPAVGAPSKEEGVKEAPQPQPQPRSNVLPFKR